MPYKSREKQLEYKRDWYKKHIERARTQAKRSRLKHREKRTLQNKQWSEQNADYIRKYRKVHYTGIYGSWYAMKQRCDNPKHVGFRNYGGRGIDYAPEWREFENFKRDMGETYKKGLTLDRVDVNAGYSPDNCRWSTRKGQANNMRKNVLITFQNKTLTLSQWAEKLGIKESTLKSRRNRGMSLDEMMTPRIYRRKLTS